MKTTIRILAIMAIAAIYCIIGIEIQKSDNIKHGVMNKSGKWLNEFKLAE